jgi:hypothetical protein
MPSGRAHRDAESPQRPPYDDGVHPKIESNFATDHPWAYIWEAAATSSDVNPPATAPPRDVEAAR